MTQSKENQSASHGEEHMLGHGFYNKHSHEQGKANTYAQPLIVEAINRIDLKQIGSEFRIADYGSAQGQNSLLPMKTAIAQIRACCQIRQSDDSDFRYAHGFADQRLDHALSNGSIFTRQLSCRRARRFLFRQRHLVLAADFSAEPHRVRLFGHR